MSIVVQIAGKATEISVDLADLRGVEELKETVREEMGWTDSSELTLKFQGEVLNDGMQLCDLGLLDGDAISISCEKELARRELAAMSSRGIEDAVKLRNARAVELHLKLDPKVSINLLREAIKTEDPPVCEILFQNGEMPVSSTNVGVILMNVCKSGKPWLLELVLQNLPVDSSFKTRKSAPLIVASSHGKYEIVRILLAHGFNAKLRNFAGSTALHHAAMGGHLDIATEILKYNRFVSLDEFTASVKQPNVQIVKLLYNNLSEPLGCLKFLAPCIATAAGLPSYEICEFLVEIGKGVPRLENALLSSITVSNTALVSFFIQKGASVHCVGNATPLTAAVGVQNEEIVEMLIDAGAEVNVPPRLGARTPLAEACSFAKPDAATVRIVNRLLAAGADVNLASGYGRNSPLSEACKTGSVEVVRILIQAGANIHKRGDCKRTPLMLAASYGRLQCVEELLRHNPSTTAVVGPRNLTAYNLALAAKNSQVAALLEPSDEGRN
eukprot:TRINITY_DN3059_c3_g1_i1.p1 TRINITY_DN3059_c3_g1~~TRINITY_DN3059_c3_g1_i1.p1  ORF type:complete len:499 (+),score=80.97 TRINITY_DN3059_c3_g1_i1:44-1540(+)